MLKKGFLQIRKGIANVTKSKQVKRHSLVGAGNLWKMKQDFQIKFLKDQGLKETDIFLDVGCGTLRGGIPIIDYLQSNNYYGIEVRKDVLMEGRKELKALKLESKNPTLISFNHFSDINLDTKFDIMFAFSVLIHFEDKIAESCFKFVSNYLSDKGVFYANVNIGERKDGEWQGFPVVFRSIDFYKDLAIKNGMALKVIGVLDELGHISGKVADKQKMLKISKA